MMPSDRYESSASTIIEKMTFARSDQRSAFMCSPVAAADTHWRSAVPKGRRSPGTETASMLPKL